MHVRICAPVFVPVIDLLLFSHIFNTSIAAYSLSQQVYDSTLKGIDSESADKLMPTNNQQQELISGRESFLQRENIPGSDTQEEEELHNFRQSNLKSIDFDNIEHLRHFESPDFAKDFWDRIENSRNEENDGDNNQDGIRSSQEEEDDDKNGDISAFENDGDSHSTSDGQRSYKHNNRYKSRNGRNRQAHQEEILEGLIELYKQNQNTNGALMKRGDGPQLSIVNPLDVLRQRLLLELARRRMKENQEQINANAEILKKIGKRSVEESTFYINKSNNIITSSSKQ